MPDDSLTRSSERAWRTTDDRRIGDFDVRPASNELVGPTGVTRLRPRLMDVLLRLAVKPGAVVSRATLLDEVWPRRAVADEVLSRAIAELRTALADDARESHYIETIPKVGYRLIAPVSGAIAPSPSNGVADAPAPAPTLAPSAPHPARSVRSVLALGAIATIATIAAAAALYWRYETGTDDTANLSRQLTGAVPFSSQPELELSPRFSPNADRIAFASGDFERSLIVIQDVATRARATFGDPMALQASPVFFPDGRRLAYFRSSSKGCGIVERSLDNGAERILVDCAEKPLPRFDLSPDGRLLVYATLLPSVHGLRRIDLATGHVDQLTTPPDAASDDVQPRFSPDSRQVAFLRGPFYAREVWRVAVDRPGSETRASPLRGIANGIAWMAIEGPLLVSADWFGFRALNKVDLPSGHSTLAGARGAQAPDVSRDGDIVYEAAAYQANLWLVDANDPNAKPRVLWPSTRYTNEPDFSPDGRRIAFASNRDSPASLFVGEFDGPMARIPLPSEHVLQRPHWSHDGRFLYAVRGAVGNVDTTSVAIRIELQSGKVEVLDALGNQVFEVYESADGESLYFAVNEGIAMRVARASAADPRIIEPLDLPIVQEFAVRGATLAYTVPGSSDIFVCALPARACAALPLDADHRQHGGWALGEHAVWIAFGNPGTLIRYDTDARRVTATLPHVPMAIGGNLAVSPDERKLVIARQELPEIDLMLARQPAR